MKVPVKWKYKKKFLVINSNENGTLEMSDVCLIISP